MSVIIVKSQKELDKIPLDTENKIQIHFGSYWEPAIIKNSYKNHVIVIDNSSVVACGHSSVEAHDNSSVEAHDNSSVVVCGHSSVVAYDNSSVVVCGHSSVEAQDNSSVEAHDNSSVVAYDNSSVEAMGNAQVVDFLSKGAILLSGNARAVHMPRNIEEFMNFYGIEHDKTTAIFYKAVHKRRTGTLYTYISDFDRLFKYEIGKKIASYGFNNDTGESCGRGIHISNKSWALNYGRNWEDLALLEVKVKIKDILLPKHSDGKVRAPKVEIIREVPFEECGALGQILLKRRKLYEKN